MNAPLEENAGEVQPDPHLTPEASPTVQEDPLSAVLHALLVSSPNSNEGDDSSTIVMSLDTQHKFDERLQLYSHGLPSMA